MNTKIEMELAYLDELRNNISTLIEENKRLKSELHNLDEDELIKRAVRLSENLFKQYMSTTFNALGFDTRDWPHGLEMDSYLKNCLGEDWYHKQNNLKVSLVATITSQFAAAFLKIGVSNEPIIKQAGNYKHEL